MRHKLTAAVAYVICFATCSPTSAHVQPAEAYLDPIDQQIARSEKGVPGRPFPCALEKSEQGVPIIEPIPTDQCVKMYPRQEWRGLWRNDFEGSRFCPAPAATCGYGSEGEKIWLESGSMRGEYGGLYEVQFTGRKTMFKGNYGHMGVSDHEIIVDRLVSQKMIEAPPPPMTKAEIDADWQRCERAGTCISTKKWMEMHKERK